MSRDLLGFMSSCNRFTNQALTLMKVKIRVAVILHGFMFRTRAIHVQALAMPCGCSFPGEEDGLGQ